MRIGVVFGTIAAVSRKSKRIPLNAASVLYSNCAPETPSGAHRGQGPRSESIFVSNSTCLAFWVALRVLQVRLLGQRGFLLVISYIGTELSTAYIACEFVKNAL